MDCDEVTKIQQKQTEPSSVLPQDSWVRTTGWLSVGGAALCSLFYNYPGAESTMQSLASDFFAQPPLPEPGSGDMLNAGATVPNTFKVMGDRVSTKVLPKEAAHFGAYNQTIRGKPEVVADLPTLDSKSLVPQPMIMETLTSAQDIVQSPFFPVVTFPPPAAIARLLEHDQLGAFQQFPKVHYCLSSSPRPSEAVVLVWQKGDASPRLLITFSAPSDSFALENTDEGEFPGIYYEVVLNKETQWPYFLLSEAKPSGAFVPEPYHRRAHELLRSWHNMYSALDGGYFVDALQTPIRNDSGGVDESKANAFKTLCNEVLQESKVRSEVMLQSFGAFKNNPSFSAHAFHGFSHFHGSFMTGDSMQLLHATNVLYHNAAHQRLEEEKSKGDSPNKELQQRLETALSKPLVVHVVPFRFKTTVDEVEVPMYGLEYVSKDPLIPEIIDDQDNPHRFLVMGFVEGQVGHSVHNHCMQKQVKPHAISSDLQKFYYPDLKGAITKSAPRYLDGAEEGVPSADWFTVAGPNKRWGSFQRSST